MDEYGAALDDDRGWMTIGLDDDRDGWSLGRGLDDDRDG